MTYTKHYLRLHLEKVHLMASNTPDRRIDCWICRHKLNHINSLNGHMKLHDKESAEDKTIILQDAT